MPGRAQACSSTASRRAVVEKQEVEHFIKSGTECKMVYVSRPQVWRYCFLISGVFGYLLSSSVRKAMFEVIPPIGMSEMAAPIDKHFGMPTVQGWNIKHKCISGVVSESEKGDPCRAERGRERVTQPHRVATSLSLIFSQPHHNPTTPKLHTLINLNLPSCSSNISRGTDFVSYHHLQLL